MDTISTPAILKSSRGGGFSSGDVNAHIFSSGDVNARSNFGEGFQVEKRGGGMISRFWKNIHP